MVQLQKTNGACASVTDPEIIEGIKLLAETEGVFAETAGGVTVASVKQLAEKNHIHPDELVVAFITGAGAKTAEAVTDSLNPALEIKANQESFAQAYQSLAK